MSTLLVRGALTLHDGAAPQDLWITDGIFSASSPAGTPDVVADANGLRVAPGLVDLQVNGAGGVDLTSDPEGLWRVGEELVHHGVTAFLPTVITSAPEAREAALAVYAAGPPPGYRGARALGLHYEGPFLAPTRRGAHPPAWLRTPDPDLVTSWSHANGVVMVTLAPELPGALALIGELTARGVIVSIGHTAADSATTQAALAAGARTFTHLGNAMEPLTGREPGPLGLALGAAGEDRPYAGVICDGHHLADTVVRLAWRALGPERFLSVSDTTAALGLPDGPTRLGDHAVEVAQGAVRLPDGTLAGSAASLWDCVHVLRRVTGCTLADAWASATSTPAALLGRADLGALTPGAAGDLVLLEGDTLVATIVGGEIVHDAGLRVSVPVEAKEGR